MSQIEEASGAPVPPSLLAFWKVVGGINFVWDYESGKRAPDLGVALPMDEMDPLCVYPPSAVPYQLEERADLQSELGVSEPFPIALAPDFLHKASVSGGEAYSILVPFTGADPVFAYEKHELPFLDYLRLAFRWAGFPGLEAHANRDDVRCFVEEFGRGLESI